MSDDTPPAGGEHGRVYVILRLTGDHYDQLPTITATSALQAARRAIDTNDTITDEALEEGVQLIAIPARNWTPITVRLERKQRLVTT